MGVELETCFLCEDKNCSGMKTLLTNDDNKGRLYNTLNVDIFYIL